MVEWVTPPLVPVIVNVYVPVVVFLHVDTESVDADVVGFGLKDAEPLKGRPLTLSETLPLKPLTGVTVTAYVVPPPRETVRLDGVALSVKSPTGAGAWTTSVTWVLCVSAPSEPVIVSAYVPAGVDAPVVTLSVDDDVGVLDTGLNVPLAPLGRPVTLQATEPL